MSEVGVSSSRQYETENNNNGSSTGEENSVSGSQRFVFPTKQNPIRERILPGNETSIRYQYEDSDLPVLIRYPIAPDKITLRDLKDALSLSSSSSAHYRFLFRTYDKDVGPLNEEIGDDNRKLPLFHDKVVVLVSLSYPF